jgi:hypothetical protein
MTLALEPPWLIRSLEAAHPASAVRYIDNILPIIYNNISGLEPVSGPKSCSHHRPWWHGCVVTSADITRVHKALSAELRRAKRDPRIVGFYIQDDVLGDFHKLNQRIHSWVAQAGLHVPTICGFGGRLDEPTIPGWMAKIASFAGDVQGDATTGNPGYVINYTPRACDMVALYPYDGNAGNRHDAAALAAAADWKMNKPVWPCGSRKCTLLNFYRYALGKRGWTSATPIIGVPQAFGWNIPNGLVWIPPTSQQLADETKAFCAGGARSIVAWEWHVTDPASTSPYKNKKLRNGLTAGVRACRAIWNGKTATTSR